MRTWQRAPRAHSCGNCSKPIEAGDLELEIGEAKLSRCARCATELFGEVPPELPPVEAWTTPTRLPIRPAFASTLKDLVAEYKAKAAGKP